MITVEKWEDYQCEEFKKQQQSNSKPTASQQQTNTNKNVNNINNIYKEIQNFTKDENLLKVIDEFMEYRKSKRKELSELALKKIFNQFKKWQYTESECIESLNNSIINGWTGVFEIKQRHNNTTQKETETPKQQYKELNIDSLTEEEYGEIVRGKTTYEEIMKRKRGAE